MKIKKLLNVWLIVVAASIAFVSCNDDEDDKLMIPSDVVENLSFTDTDFEEGTIGGKLTWKLPADESYITGYVIYLSDSSTEKGDKQDIVEAGKNEYVIDAGTPFKSYIHVIAQNAAGESDNKASLQIRDNTTPVVANLSFVDTDKRYQKIGGRVSWEAPVLPEEKPIQEYVIYFSDKANEKGSEYARINKSLIEYEIPEGKDFESYLQIAIVIDGEEMTDFAVIAVNDQYELYAYILNRGNYNGNNATIGRIDNVTTEYAYTPFIYQEANGASLGESAQDMLIYGSKIYVAVTFSNRLTVLDMNGKLLETIEPTNAAGDPLNPRYLTAYKGKVYASYYYGHSVGVIDTLALKEEAIINVGRYPEGVTIADNKLYVANSGGGDFPTYGNSVSVINLENNTVEAEIQTVVNPTILSGDKYGNVYVICMGDYGAVKNTLQRIDATTQKATTLDNGTFVAVKDDIVYSIYAQWGDPNPQFISYNTVTGNVISSNYIKSDVSFQSVNSLSVDPVTGNIFISDREANSTATMYIFSPEGELIHNFDTKGYDTQGAYFPI